MQLHGTFPMQRYPHLARAVERHPFHELTVHDVVWWRPVWPILTLVAANTERVLVGPDVTHPYLRHPLDTAAQVAALDELSGGRAILGLGAGSLLAPAKIPSVRPLVAVRECHEFVCHILAGGGSSYDGELFQATPAARLLWEPPRRAIPSFVGAYGPKMVREVASWASELRPPAIWATDFFASLKADALAAASAAGNDGFRVGCDVWVSVDDDRSAARALGRRILAQFLPALKPLTDFYETPAAEIEAVARRAAHGDLDGAAEEISDRTLDTFVAAGTPAEIVAGVERLLEHAPSAVTFSGRLGPDPERALELLGAEVLPQLT